MSDTEIKIYALWLASCLAGRGRIENDHTEVAGLKQSPTGSTASIGIVVWAFRSAEEINEHE